MPMDVLGKIPEESATIALSFERFFVDLREAAALGELSNEMCDDWMRRCLTVRNIEARYSLGYIYSM